MLHTNNEPIPSRLLIANTKISFIITTKMIAYFVLKITTTLRKHENLLTQTKKTELNNERIVQLKAFATSTAHKLNTPLTTITIIVKELQEH